MRNRLHSPFPNPKAASFYTLKDKDIPFVKDSGTYVPPSVIRKIIGDDTLDPKTMLYQERPVSALWLLLGASSRWLYA